MAGESLREQLTRGLNALDLALEENSLEQLLAYLALLQKWNRTYNLTAVRNPADMVTRHLLDSLSIRRYVKGRVLDAGTGAGLPGIPLAIVQPDLHVTLLDSAGKKVRFMQHVKRQLGLGNIEPVHARLESFTAPEVYDIIVSRAFASLGDFISGAAHLCGDQTHLLAMKGQLPEEEMQALPEAVTVQAVHKLEVPGLHQQRHLVIMTVRP